MTTFLYWDGPQVFRYMDSCYKDKTVSKQSYLYNGIPSHSKTTSLYWNDHYQGNHEATDLWPRASADMVLTLFLQTIAGAACIICIALITIIQYTDSSVQDYSISIANTLEILQSCTKHSIYVGSYDYQDTSSSQFHMIVADHLIPLLHQQLLYWPMGNFVMVSSQFISRDMKHHAQQQYHVFIHSLWLGDAHVPYKHQWTRSYLHNDLSCSCLN